MSTFKITFLGTCACDFSDKLNNEFKDKFDYNARRASAVLINDRYLIDSGLHILDSLRIANKEPEQITDIFITHLHSDHFNLNNIEKIANSKSNPLNLWLREDAQFPQIKNVCVHKMKPYQNYKVEAGLFITGLESNHDQGVYPQHILLQKNEKKLFYGCDGAWLLTNTYNHLKRSNLDLMVLDATVGDYEGDYRIAEHNSIPMIRQMLPSLKNEKIITQKTKLYLSHIAPSLHRPHVELEKTAEAFGGLVAYDGLEIEI